MTFRDKTLGCGFYFICRYKLLESSRDATNVRHVALKKKQLLFKTSSHFCSNYTFPNTKITKCNCLAQIDSSTFTICCILCLLVPCVCMFVCGLLFEIKVYFVFNIFSCVVKNISPVKVKAQF